MDIEIKRLLVDCTPELVNISDNFVIYGYLDHKSKRMGYICSSH